MDKKINFEDTLKELETIVAKLEDNNCSLDDAIALFGQGVEKVKLCDELLKDAKLKIERMDEND